MSFLQTVVKLRGKSLTLFIDAVADDVHHGLGEIERIKSALPLLPGAKGTAADIEKEKPVAGLPEGGQSAREFDGFISDRTGTDG